MVTTRSIETLKTLLHEPGLLLSQKLKLAIELHIAQLPESEQPKAWQQLPFLVQFGPLAIKYWKDLPLLQRTNPTIRNGGFTEYEKHAIYEHFPKKTRITHVDILETTFPGADALTQLHRTHAIGLPCMLKANVGERGVGIHYIADHTQRLSLMNAYTQGIIHREPSTLQSYCNWQEEWCLQFYHYPNGPIHIGSLVQRNIPFVLGDGTQTVQGLVYELSLSDAQKEKIISTLKQEESKLLHEIPALHERIQVVRKASIDFGTTYTDHTHTLSPAEQKQLVDLLNHLLAHLPYLSVGRFDLKAKSLESLLSGEVKIIECNAGGGIPTHVYDESLSISEKYEILNTHFARMKEIALIHKEAGRYAGNQLGAFWQLIKAAFSSLHKKGISLTNTKSTSNQRVITLYKELFTLMRGED